MDSAEPPIRVLVVDDSVVMRRVIARALERDPGIGRTDFAANGRLALTKIAGRRPDVVVLDLEMPELDGFETLTEIRRTDPALPVVLFSSVDERIAAATLESLSLGVTDFVVKPRATALEQAESYVEEFLTPVVLGLAGPRTMPAPAEQPRRPLPAGTGASVEVVVVGTSTGGPDALARLLRELPADLPVPVLIVQHMPPMFTRLLAERLDRVGGLRVVEASADVVLAPGTAYVAPGDRHLEVRRTEAGVVTVLTDGPAENSCRPAADVLFRAVAQVYGAGVLAVVLTGMGYDGLRGCRVVREGGGQVVVQDPETAIIGSMPAAVAEAGLAQAVLPLDRLAPELLRRVRR